MLPATIVQAGSSFSEYFGSLSRTQQIALVSGVAGLSVAGYLGISHFRSSDPSGSWKRNNFSSIEARRFQYGRPKDLNRGFFSGHPSRHRFSSESVATVVTGGGGDTGSVASSGPTTLTTILPDDRRDGLKAEGPQQLGVVGMDYLQECLRYWEAVEDALSNNTVADDPSSKIMALPSKSQAKAIKEVQGILDDALRLMDRAAALFLSSDSSLLKDEEMTVASSSVSRAGRGGSSFAPTPIPLPPGSASEKSRYSSLPRTPGSSSSLESFVSCVDDVEFFMDAGESEAFAFLQYSLDLLDKGQIRYKEEQVRTQLVGLSSDREFLGKMHCLRLSFEYLLQDRERSLWLISSGRRIISLLFVKSDRDPSIFQMYYDSLVNYIQTPMGLQVMRRELAEKGVLCISFYDLVLDYVMEGFAHIESPGSVAASLEFVLTNRWVSDRFKELAVGSSLCGILKMKRSQVLEDGYLARFYDLLSALAPFLCWGFFGSDEKLKDICFFCKTELLDFLTEIFSFDRVRYSRLEDLSVDVFSLLQQRLHSAERKLEDGFQSSLATLDSVSVQVPNGGR